MQKNKNVVYAVALTSMLTIGTITANHIDNINKELLSTKKQVSEFKKDNTQLSKELKESIDSNIKLKKENKKLKKQVKSLDKKIKEQEYPTKRVGTPVNITMTFYGDFAHENGGYAGIDANGNKLIAGTIASNYYPQGTQFEFNGQIYTVRDRGGSSFNSPNRLDVFVPRFKNESNSSYAKRIRHYGVKKVTMYKR